MPLGQPNFIAYAALLAWALVTLVAFIRLRPPVATMVCLLGGVMFLPEQTAIDPPLLPPIDKGSMASFTCLRG